MNIQGNANAGRVGAAIDESIRVSGTVRDQAGISARLSPYGAVSGAVVDAHSVECGLSGSTDIECVMQVGDVEFAEYPDYKGSYTVTPGKNDQRINTNLKVVRDNITIKGVPAYEASNPFGGTTFSIG